MSICDPTCGSGGMLIESVKFISKHGGNPRNLVLEGQDVNYGTIGMCKMNMVLHGIEDFRIEYGDAIVNPTELVTQEYVRHILFEAQIF
jgi:type I restriction enzyme M protein